MVKRFPFFILFLIFLFQKHDMHGQDSTGFGIGAFIDYSFAGASVSLTGSLNKEKHSFYLGYKYPLKALPGGFQSNWGLLAGYRYYFTIEKKWNPFLNLDYQFSIKRAYTLQDEATKRNYLQQINFGYGLAYRLSETISIGNSIGGGIYIQNLYSRIFNERNRFLGYDGLIRFFVQVNL